MRRSSRTTLHRSPLRWHAPAAIVGREHELEAIAGWLDGPAPAVLQIEGEAGIGKTTLWEEGVRLARDAGALVIACRPAEVESPVSYGALAGLLEPLLAIVADAVPAPRRRALEGALRLREVSTSSLDETAVALGALSTLREAAARHHVVLAVDDAQWLDASSRIVLTYALRNLGADDRVSVLTTARAGTRPGMSGRSCWRAWRRSRCSTRRSTTASSCSSTGTCGSPIRCSARRSPPTPVRSFEAVFIDSSRISCRRRKSAHGTSRSPGAAPTSASQASSSVRPSRRAAEARAGQERRSTSSPPH